MQSMTTTEIDSGNIRRFRRPPQPLQLAPTHKMGRNPSQLSRGHGNPNVLQHDGRRPPLHLPRPAHQLRNNTINTLNLRPKLCVRPHAIGAHDRSLWPETGLAFVGLFLYFVEYCVWLFGE